MYWNRSSYNNNNLWMAEILTRRLLKFCEVCWNRHIFQCFNFLRRSKISNLLFSTTCIRITMVYNTYWWTSASTSILTLMTLLIPWSIVPMWLVLHCSIAIIIDFAQAKKRDLFPWIMCSHAAFVFPEKHIRMCSIGQWITHSITYKTLSLVGLFVCGTPFVRVVIIFCLWMNREGIK